MRTINTIIASIALAVLAHPGGSVAQTAAAPAAPVTAASRDVALALAASVEENFVRPDAAAAYARTLRGNAASGKYDTLAGKALADAVTADLQSVSPDVHLRLFAPVQGQGQGEAGRSMRGRNGEPPIARSGWLAPGVAYIGFTAFPGDEATLAQLRAFLDGHRDATTLVIDAREHRGGGFAEMDMLFAALFAEPTELVEMDTRVAVEQRGESVLEDGPTLRRVAGPDTVVRRAHMSQPLGDAGPLVKAKVYYLTSGRTASAAEHVALAFKHTGRATLIGETTRGAGNYGRFFDLPGGYRAFIPLGRTFDPATGQGWEGRGIAPDVQVPADRALDEALRRAGISSTGTGALAALG